MLRGERLAHIKESIIPVYASSNAKVFPYQIAAARFALRSDYLKGCILCDEASLGKTYEALLVAGQKWYEGKENILIVVPSSLVTQWIRKIKNDFSIPYLFWNNTKKLPDEKGIIITTYDTAVRYSDIAKTRQWDLVIFDEADTISKPENKSVITLKEIAGEAFKLLLTPTPITLSIMDIYGLIHFIDESVLPDSDWFYKRYFRRPENYHELTEWVSQFCFRTLKCQTTNYVNFSRRLPITVDYELSKEEKLLYKLVSAYIISDNKAAYPEMDNYNLNLLFFKTLSSSAYAFSNMLKAPIERAYGIEKQTLLEIQKLASEIYVNSKTAQLLKILKTVFSHLKTMKVNRKAVIFVDNQSTQTILHNTLYANGYQTIHYNNAGSIDEFSYVDNSENQILIATDEAAKGLDLEFCPVVINYDLPYDAIKIEQRICRCHRQGQNSDVLVINLLSKENLADVRILELINKRTLQFNGIFGMSDDIVGNFDVKIKEVLKNFRHHDEVAQDFKENLTIHRSENEQLAQQTEDILFTTFNEDISNNVSISPKYVEEQTEELNNDLWELVKYYFTVENHHYIVDEKERTLTKKELEENEEPMSKYEFRYYTGGQSKYHIGRNKYGMSKDLPYYERLTFTSPLVKSILEKYSVFYNHIEGVMFVKEDIEPCQIKFYKLDIYSNKTRKGSPSFLTGQTISGKILSEDECRNLLNLAPVKKIQPKTISEEKAMEPFKIDFSNVDVLEKHIPCEEILQNYMSEKKTSFDYAIKKSQLIAHQKKMNVDKDIKDLKAKIDELKKEKENTKYSTFEKLKIQKEIAMIEDDFFKKEENIFFEKQKIDVETEKEIQKILDISNYIVRPDLIFHVFVYPISMYQE